MNQNTKMKFTCSQMAFPENKSKKRKKMYHFRGLHIDDDDDT